MGDVEAKGETKSPSVGGEAVKEGSQDELVALAVPTSQFIGVLTASNEASFLRLSHRGRVLQDSDWTRGSRVLRNSEPVGST